MSAQMMGQWFKVNFEMKLAAFFQINLHYVIGLTFLIIVFASKTCRKVV